VPAHLYESSSSIVRRAETHDLLNQLEATFPSSGVSRGGVTAKAAIGRPPRAKAGIWRFLNPAS
jgi:hypothetical protein